MSRRPVLPLPPHGAFELLLAMQVYLPEAWQQWEACLQASERLREQSQIPPGGRRWPETDPRRVEAIKRERTAAFRAAAEAEDAARKALIVALVDNLRSGALVAYIVPASLGDGYHQIPRSLWESLRVASLRRSTVSGAPIGTIKIVICRATDDEGKPRPTGRPRAEGREHIEAEYRRRLEAGEGLNGAHREADELVRLVRAAYPELPLPQKQTVARWIRDEFRSREPQGSGRKLGS